MQLNEIMDLVKEGNNSFESFKDNQSRRLDAIEKFIDDSEAKSNRAGLFAGGVIAANQEWQDAFDSMKQRDFNGRVDFNIKSITSDASLTVPGVMQPMIVTAPTYSLHLSDYIPTRVIDMPSLVINRIGSTDTAGVQANQGDAKKALQVLTSPLTVNLEQVAAYATVSTQALQDVVDLQSTVNSILNTRLKATIDGMIYTAASAVGAHTAYTSTSATPVDNLVGAVAKLANYGLQGTVFLNPADYATVVLTKATDGMFLGFPMYDGLSIKQASAVPVGKFLVSTLDGMGIGLAIRSVAMLMMGFVNDQLTTNERTILCEQRVAPFVSDANRVLIGNLVAA